MSSTSLFHRVCLLLVSVAAVSSCATLPPVSCEEFEQTRRATRYDTVYRYSEADTRLAAKSFASIRRMETLTARWYTLRGNRPVVRQCEHLYLNKELYLLRGNAGNDAVLHELREVYTGDGRLIASRREDVTNQLKSTGFYYASVPFPIPKVAPPDTYRIVTKLMAKQGNAAEKTLASSSVEFRVQ